MRYFLTLACLTALLLFSNCGKGLRPDGDPISGPATISDISSEPNGDGTVTVTIRGSNFQNGSTVTISGENCYNVNVVSQTRLTCILPNGTIALVNVIITAPNGVATPTGPTSPFVSAIATSVSASNALPNGLTPWTNPTWALTPDNDSASLGASIESQYLELKGYFTDSAYSFPNGATIDGVKANCYWYGNTGSGGKAVWEYSIKLLKGGTVSGDEKGDNNVQLPDGWAMSHDFGGNSDRWGLALTPSDIRDAGFGIAVSVHTDPGRAAKVNYCQLSVYFH